MKSKLLIIFLLFFGVESFGQNFVQSMFSISRKKEAYVYTKDGNLFIGRLKTYRNDKGILTALKVQDSLKEVSIIEPTNVHRIYVSESIAKDIRKHIENNSYVSEKDKQEPDRGGTSIQESIGNTDLYVELIAKQLNCIEETDVLFGKKVKKRHFQILNPYFCKHMRVYANPSADEGLTSEQKSFYIKKGDNPAFKVNKRTYKKRFYEIYEDAPKVLELYGYDPLLKDIEKHVWLYDQNK